MTVTTSIPHGKYHIWTVGCQMNQADSQRIQTILEELGWEETTMDQANLVVLNTCSVRKAPEEKVHNQLASLKHAKARRNDLLVALMGCMIGNQKTIDELQKRWTPISGAGCLDVEFMPFADETIPSEPISPTIAAFNISTIGKHTVLP